MKRSFIYLFLTTIVVLASVFYLAQQQQATRKHSSGNDLFMPGLADTINDVERVNVMAAGNIALATLNRKGDEWQVEQMQGYTANWPRLQKVLAGLAKARIIEAKTDKPEYYSRLGVADMAS